MATDIWIHIEHRSKRTHKFVYDFEAEGERIYPMFGALAGTRSYIEPIYDPRGLPEDITLKALRAYKRMGEDAHTPSWLSTMELRECLDLVLKKEVEKGSGEETIKEWLAPYEDLYVYMKSHEDKGEPSRIVFWFDN